jgi:hypothetical protein
LIQCFLENAGMRRLLHSERRKKKTIEKSIETKREETKTMSTYAGKN